MTSSGSNPTDPNKILQTNQGLIDHFRNETLPYLWALAKDLPSKTLQRYIERDRSYDARQGPVGNPFQGFIDPGLADGIDERRRRYEEYLKKRREEREKEGKT